jgi:hypothetical protein
MSKLHAYDNINNININNNYSRCSGAVTAPFTSNVVIRDGRPTAQYNKVGGVSNSKQGCVFYNNNEHSKSPTLLVCGKCTLDNSNCSCISSPHFTKHHEEKRRMAHGTESL